MIETQSNGDSIGNEQLLPVRIRLAHPKLHAHTFSFHPQMPFHLVVNELTRDNMLALFNNFHLQAEDKPIRNQRDYFQLIKGPHKDPIEVQVVFEHYKYATAMHHFKIVSHLLKNHNRLANIFKGHPKNEQKASNELEIESLLVELMPEAFRGHKWDVDEVIAPNYKGELHQGRHEKVELVHFLELSGFNPPPQQAQFAGDFFYLHLKTLENVDLHITACSNGFYVNQSKINCYNPTIQNGKQTYISLLDLLTSSSEKFSAVLNRIIDPSPSSLLERIWRRSVNIVANHSPEQSKWLDSCENEHHWNSRKDLFLRELENASDDHRDWNQQFVELSRMSERLSTVGEEGDRWTAQAYRQLYAEFTTAATDAARRIVQGKVKAINHNDEEKRHIYIFNKIFMSATTETPYDHKVSKEEELLPSSTSVNADILNLQRLSALKTKGLRLLQTMLINYRGWRLLVQTIIPGLLTSELNSITLYGALDDSKSIQADQKFKELLLPICKELLLDENVLAIDKSDSVVSIAVSPQIKGIKSTNGEYFLCDLQKFSPRDLNYPGVENEGCILRPKLVSQFIEEHKINFATAPPINTNIGTDIKFMPGPRHEQQETFLLNAAKYLKEGAIPKLINALKSKNPGDFLTDSAGISAIFHQFGVNMRYLGFVERHESLKQNIQVRICLTRVILVRSLKHLFRTVLRNSNALHIAAVTSHVLNCIFGKKTIINQLSTIEDTVEERVQVNESKRKKKKKNRQEEKEIKPVVHDENKSIKTIPCKYLTMRPQDIWEEVNKLAKARFDFSFEPNIMGFHEKGLFRLTYQKYATLRDLCLCIGLVLERKDYNLSQADPSDTLPFAPKNILYFKTTSKTITLSPSPQLKSMKVEADRLFSQNQIKQSLAIYSQIVKLIRERKEGQCLLSYCLGQISRIEYMNGNLREAISIQTQNLIFSQRTGREDSLQVTRCYSRLGLYCMSLAKQLSLWLLYKGLHLMLMSFGEAYPDILINFANIARVHQQNREANLTASCYLKAIDLLTQIYGGKNHVNTSFCYSSLASLHYELGQYKKSADYQGQAVSILQKVLSTDDSRYNNAVQIHKMYKEYLQSKGGMGMSRQNDHLNRKK